MVQEKKRAAATAAVMQPWHRILFRAFIGFSLVRDLTASAVAKKVLGRRSSTILVESQNTAKEVNGHDQRDKARHEKQAAGEQGAVEGLFQADAGHEADDSQGDIYT